MNNETQQNQSQNKKVFWWLIGIIVFFIVAIALLNGDNKTSSEKENIIEKVGNYEQEKTVPEPALIELSGAGQQASKKFTLESGLSIFHLTHSGTRHFSVKLLDENGEYIELLTNTTGQFDGSKAVEIKMRGEYIMDVSADGKWTIKIEQPRRKIAQSEASTFTGIGQQVSPLVKIDKGLKTFKMKHSGNRHFSIKLLNKDGEYIELLTNTTGQFDGSKAIGITRSDLYLFDISADGEWSISIE